ncbi:endonuclease [Sucra jujuba nucleopolyhedrovirus]|uniref:Endonuclease n=1 Tax=Sucra jujuba nucleopolyhedrovirus TaxID=1563660 RepID=A0A097P926_9ABAC|nr:endonuclease [Sucra jujuba nucleopolyhedrovirus]AIU41331.1 endonuclease [Sucra jujuba nucleopolyhedrovirus]
MPCGGKPYFLYVIKTDNDDYYTGISVDTKSRFRKHCSSKGAKYLRNKNNLQLMYTSPVSFCIRCALRVERAVKKRGKPFKTKLIRGQVDLQKLCKIPCDCYSLCSVAQFTLDEKHGPTT